MQKIMKFLGLDAESRKEVWEGAQITMVIAAGFYSAYVFSFNPFLGVVYGILTIGFGKMVLFR